MNNINARFLFVIAFRIQPRFEEATWRCMELQARLDRDAPAVAD